MKIIIGIDPGASGALVWIDEYGRAVCHPVSKTAPLEALQDAMANSVLSPEYQYVAYLERVGGYIAGVKLPGSAMFKMGHSAGYWEGMLAALGVRTILVRPQEWQAGLPGVSGHKIKADRKRAIKEEALRRYPNIKITNDIADALMIADYGMRKEKP